MSETKNEEIQKAHQTHSSIMEKAEDSRNPLFYVQPLLGPVNLYNVVPPNERGPNRPLPWKDGNWSQFIRVKKNGTTVTFKFNDKPLGEEANGCYPEDMLMFVYFYYQFLIAKQGTRDSVDLLSHLEYAVLKQIAMNVRSAVSRTTVQSK